jgi:hypothetical protein
MWIRVLLLACVVATLVLFVRGQHGQRLRANKRIAFFAFLAVNAYAVLRPEDVMWVAVKLGVGRGADLVLYLLVVCFVFSTLNMYLRQRQLEQRLADVTRALALQQAVTSNEHHEHHGTAAVHEDLTSDAPMVAGHQAPRESVPPRTHPVVS